MNLWENTFFGCIHVGCCGIHVCFLFKKILVHCDPFQFCCWHGCDYFYSEKDSTSIIKNKIN